MKNSLIRPICAMTLAVAVLAGCSKESPVEIADFAMEEQWADLEQELLILETWTDAEDAALTGRWMEEDEYLFTPGCADRSWEVDSPNHTRILTLDFGDSYCLGEDGLYRKGLIRITFVGPRHVPGSTKLTEFIEYYVMDREHNGSKAVEFLGNHQYSRSVDMTFNTTGGSSSLFAMHLVEQISGYDTPERQDDIFQVTGGGGGVRPNGVSFTAEISSPLLRKLQPGCYRNFVDGVIEFTSEGGVLTLLDFDPVGGAPCDKLASLTRNGETRLITLR